MLPFRWPIYEIREHTKLWEENNILYITTKYKTYIIDNKNLAGDSLGMRRLRLRNIDDINIYKLKRICYTLFDVYKCKSKYFIDSNGKLISYNKKIRRKLIYRKVLDIKTKNRKILCKCSGIFKPIEVPFIPKIMPKYLGLLIILGDYQLYELCNEYKPDTWRLW